MVDDQFFCDGHDKYFEKSVRAFRDLSHCTDIRFDLNWVDRPERGRNRRIGLGSVPERRA